MKGSFIFSLLSACALSASQASDPKSWLSGGFIGFGVFTGLSAINYMIEESKMKK